MIEWALGWLIKLVTKGITALCILRVLIDKYVCDLDVGLRCPMCRVS